MQTLVFPVYHVYICTTRHLLLAVIALTNNVSPLTLKTEDIGLHLHEDTEIVLNCIYDKERNEDIVSIRWQKQINGTFENLATFPSTGIQEPFIEKDMERFYGKRTELIAPSKDSFSAILIIKNITCDDAGIYQCLVQYYFDKTNREKSSLSTVAFKAKTPNQFDNFPYKLQENQSLTMTCKADVGAPHGSIKIWKLAKDSNETVLIFTSNTSDYKTENCTDIINATFTYTVSREDNGARFRCSSQNVLKTGAGPSLESQKISVSYGPDEPFILLTPNKSSFYVGEDLTLHCQTDSNPRSNFTWSFLSKNDYNEMEKKLLPDNAELILKNIQLNNAGDYTCTVNNGIGTDHKIVSIRVRKPLKGNTFSCDQCGHSEICLKESGEAHCVTNVWMSVAIVFISFSMTFVAFIMLLIKQRRLTQEKQLKTTNSLQLQGAGDSSCTVNNGIGTDHTVGSISVQEPLKRNRTTFSCKQCCHSEICPRENGEAHCVTNVWMSTAIMFIIPYRIFVCVIIYLIIKQRKSLQNQQSTNNNCLQSQSVDHPSHPSTSIEYSLAFSGEPFDSPNHPSEAETLLSESASGSQTVCPIPYDHDAGYSTHQDLIGMQEQCTMLPQPDENNDPTASQENVMLSNPDEHDDPTASQENVMLSNPDEHDDPTVSQEKVQYAEVSKKQRTENV